jgi:hypothetical protein
MSNEQYNSPNPANKTSDLQTSKQDKLSRFSNKKQNANLDDSYSELDDGSFVSNKNKIWNDLSGEEYQNLFEYAKRNVSLTTDESGTTSFPNGETYNGRTRFNYLFGTKDSTNEQVKFGIARGDLTGSEERYTPKDGYGWESGPLGVDVNKKEFDILYPDNVAVMLEALAFGRRDSLDGRVVDKKENPDISDPFTRQGRFSSAPSSVPNLSGVFGKALQNVASIRDWDLGNVDTFVSFMDKVGEIESNNIADRTQLDSAEGIGRGKFQYETSAGSGANKTAVNRLFRSLPEFGLDLADIPKEDREILTSEDPDFSKLSEDTQNLVFLADKYQAPEADLDGIVNGRVDLKDAWLDSHWKGSADDRQSKIDMWEDRFKGEQESFVNSFAESVPEEGNSTSFEDHIRETRANINAFITSNDYDDYGSGGSEYYKSREALFGKPSEYDEVQGKELFTKYIADMQERFPKNGIVDKELNLQRISDSIKQAQADNFDGLDRAINAVKGFGSTFVSELIINPLDAFGDATGIYDLGTAEEKEKYMNSTFGYNSIPAQEAMEEVGKQWDILANTELSNLERTKAAGRGILEAFLTPELLGTSLGALMSWMTPGALLKAVGVGSKYAKTVQQIDRLVEGGKLTKVQAKAQKLKRLGNVEGIKATLASQSGFIASAAGNVNNQYEEFVKNNNGVELEGSEKAKWFAGRFAWQMVNQNLDKIVDVNIIKNPGVVAALVPAVKAISDKEFGALVKVMYKGVLKTTENAGKETAQEYAQTMMELFNSRYGSEQFSNVEEFTAFISDERNTREAGIGALAGAGGALQFDLVGGITPAVSSTVQGLAKKANSSNTTTTSSSNNELEAFTPTVDSVDATEEESTKNTAAASKQAEDTLGKFALMLGDEESISLAKTKTTETADSLDTPILSKGIKDNIDDYELAIQEIEQAEAVYESSEENTDLELKILRKSKRELYNAVMDSESPVLGSNYTPEDVLEEFFDTVDVVDGKLTLTVSEEARVAQYAKDNDIPPLRFESLRNNKISGKDASEVQKEIFDEGPRSAVTYRKTLQKLVNTPNPDKNKIAKTLGSVNQFLNTQENRLDAYDSTLKEVKADIVAYNKSVNGKLSLAQGAEKTKLKRGKDVQGYDKAFVAVSENKDGTLRINKESLATSKSIKDNIDYLNRTKARYESKALKLISKSDTSTDKGIFVRPSTSKIAKVPRDNDTAAYAKAKVTKAIIDPRGKTNKWKDGSDYQKDNKGRINTGNYTKDDVVVLNSTSKSFPQSNIVRKQLAAIREAGASVMLDTDIKTMGSLQLKPITKLLNSYGLSLTVKNGVKMYAPSAEAEVINTKIAKAIKAKKAKETALTNMIKAMAIKESTPEDKLTAKEKSFYAAALEKAAPYFNNNTENMEKHYNTAITAIIKEGSDKLVDIASNEGVESSTFNEAILSLRASVPKGVFNKIDKDSEAKIEELSNGENLVTAWNEAFKESKKGNTDLGTWLSDNISNPMKIVKDMLNNAIGKGGKTVYAYLNNNNDFAVKGSVDKIPKNEDGTDKTYQTIEIDPSKYVDVTTATPLNTLAMSKLKISDNLQFNKMVANAVKLLKSTIKPLDEGNKGAKEIANNFFEFSDSPAASLIFNKDLEVNENISIAMYIAVKGFIRDNNQLIMKGKKSKKDISEILHIDESQLSREAVDMLSDKGLLYKTAANSVGRNVAAMMGLSRKSDSESDSQLYDALIADLGQMSLLMGVKEGILEIDNSLKANAFAETVMSKDKNAFIENNDAKVIFIQAVKGKEDIIKEVVKQSKEISETIPNTDPGRKEPSFKKISKGLIAKTLSKIRKEKLGLKIADGSQEALKELIDTEWSADLELAQEFIDNQELMMPLLGYIKEGSDKYEKLSFEEKESQLSINRGVEKSFEEMQWLLKNREVEGSQRQSLYFNYFFSKNGRFFVDSNTINPQNDKHLHRFMTQPASHINQFTRSGNIFKIKGKDVSDEVNYALAQAFGFATDKKDTQKITDFSTKILTSLNSKKKIKKAKQKFLETGEFKKLGIKMEHLGHAMQAFAFLEKSLDAKGGSFESSLSAEFDAVTSGFGIKNLQMPIITVGDTNDNNWHTKVGFVKNTDPMLEGITTVSMNDLLDKGRVTDSYQTLAIGVEGFTFDTMFLEVNSMIKNTNKIAVTDKGYSKNLWDALHNHLPKVVDGAVDSVLRGLFKYPFMTFNYAASIKSIRKNLLTGELLTGLAKDMAGADLSEDSSIVQLMQAFVGKDGDISKLQSDIRSMSMSKVKANRTDKFTIEDHLGQMIEASYGAKVEEILTDKFAPFIAAQDDVNNSFKAMFEIFAVSFEEELKEARKKGAVSISQEKEIYNKLKDKWPMIKGPLSNMEEELESGDGIGVYDTKTASPYGAFSGRKAARTRLGASLKSKLGQDSIRVSHMVKQITSAVAAGSVLPIHFIDGAIMADTINNLAAKGIKGITSIHDAIIPPLGQFGESQKAYNKATVDRNASYSFINEIVKTLDRFIDQLPKDTDAYTKRKLPMIIENEKVEIPVKDFLMSTRNSVALLANKVNKGRKSLYDELLNKGAKIMHMAGTADGVYDIPANKGAVKYVPVAKYASRSYNDSIKVDSKTVDSVDVLAKQLKCKG